MVPGSFYCCRGSSEYAIARKAAGRHTVRQRQVIDLLQLGSRVVLSLATFLGSCSPPVMGNPVDSIGRSDSDGTRLDPTWFKSQS